MIRSGISFKARALSKLIIVTLTIFLISSLAAASACFDIFSIKRTAVFDPYAIFSNVGLDLNTTWLRFEKSHPKEESPGIEMTIFSSTGSEIGSMSVWAIDFPLKTKGTGQWPVWRTDTSGTAIKGKGIGQVMYLMAAAKFFRSYPNNRLISTDHSGYANEMWEALVRKGFARKFSINKRGMEVEPIESLGVIYEITKNTIPKAIKDFVSQFPIRNVK
jgi:hypothetical protein